jgi:N-acetylglucosamine kinase-like BadF-type ATPase
MPSPETPTVLAFDGGNSKTDLLLVDADGRTRGEARTVGFHPYGVGSDYAIAALADSVKDVLRQGRLPAATHVSACLANVDSPEHGREVTELIRSQGWAHTVSVANDSMAVLHAGSPAGWGVAVVCGAGTNALGVAQDGRTVSFPALGRLTGDWGGGHTLAEEAMWFAARAEDGRGPATALADAITDHFALDEVNEVGRRFDDGTLPAERLHELSPVVFRVADDGDRVATSLVHRQAEEVVTMAVTCLTRLSLLDTPLAVVLGGGVLSAGHPMLVHRTTELLAERAPYAEPVVLAVPPVHGSAVLGLRHLTETGLVEPNRLTRACAVLRGEA